MDEKIRLIKHEVILVDHIPMCHFCATLTEKAVPGPYDFKTHMGPWANGCDLHWKCYRAFPELGTGMGQLWVTLDQVDPLDLKPIERAKQKSLYDCGSFEEMEDLVGDGDAVDFL
jgi:hypothetical protein